MKAENKTIIVTGGGSGMGRELVLNLLAKGAKVAAIDVNEKALQETAALVGDRNVNLSLFVTDITDSAGVEGLLEKVISKFGAVDGIINNDGIIQPFIRVNDLSYEVIERVMNINFYGTLYLIKTFLPHLLTRPEAHIVDTSSMGGFLPVPGQTIPSSKSRLIGRVRKMLRFLDKKITFPSSIYGSMKKVPFKRQFLLSALMIAMLMPTVVAQKKTAYLFTYFTGNGKSEEAIHFAISNDGYHYKALNNDAPVLNSATISSTGGVRDPHILRGDDGKTFFMVATDMQVAKNGWGPNTAMVMLKSTDLINWTSKIVDIPAIFKKFLGVNRVWAPQTIYDPQQKKYMLYWSMRFGNQADVIYYAYANKDFTGLEGEPKQLFFSPANSACIDADIILKDGKYNLFFKTEGAGNGIKKAVSANLTEGYVLQDKYLQQTTDPVEGSGVFKLNEGNDYILMYDVYTKGRYQFTRSSDLENFKVVDQDVTMDFHPRHGTVLPITAKELQRLLAKWGAADD